MKTFASNRKKGQEIVLAFAAALIALLASMSAIAPAYAASQTSGFSAAQADMLTTQGYDSSCALLDSDGYLYRCDAAGNKSDAAWEMSGYYVYTIPADFEYVETLFISAGVEEITQKHGFYFEDVRRGESYGIGERNHVTFADMRNISKIVFKLDSNGRNAATWVNGGAFEGMEALQTVENFERTQVTSMGNSAFRDCTSLRSVKLPSCLKLLGSSAFNGCESISQINLEDTQIVNLEENAFLNCRRLRKASTPMTLRSIGGSAFDGCISLEKISLNNALTTIGKKAFMNCELVSEITIPKSVLDVGWGAFYGCSSLKKVTFKSALYPHGGGSVFDWTPITDSAFQKEAFIYVPWAKLNLYRNSSDWSGYYNRIVVKKKAQHITAKSKSAKVSSSKLKRGKVALKGLVKVKGAKRGVSYKKVSGNKKISVSKATGKITLKKGLKKGVYKVKVKATAVGNDFYRAAAKTVSVKIVVT